MKFLKSIIIILISIGILLGGFLLILPIFLKTSIGKNLVIESINSFIPGKIDFEELNLQWNGSQNIKGLILKTSDNQDALNVKEIVTDFSLFNLLVRTNKSKDLKIDQMKFSRFNKDQSSNLELAIGYNFSEKTRLSIQKVISLFGDRFDISYFGNINLNQGPVKGVISGLNGLIKIDGKISENKFTLNLPLEAQFNITHEISYLFFSKNIPLLKYAISSERPVILKIMPENFSLPIRHFDLNQLTFNEASIDFGKLKFENHDEFKPYLNYVTNRLDQIDIWFTPIYFKLNQSLLSIHRFDWLVNGSFHLASWGTVNLETHEGKFIVGVPFKTLQQIVNLKELNTNDFFQISVLSKGGKIKINEKEIMLKLSSLLGKGNGEPKNKLLKKVFQQIAKHSKNDSMKEEVVPQPTTPSFPWE